MLSLLLLFLAYGPLVLAKTVHYNWDITWVNAAPGGVSRAVIGINGKWPCPQVDVDVGDRLVVKINNCLGNQSTSLHWHGIHQNGTSFMDGASGASQCPVAPGESFTYDFKVSAPFLPPTLNTDRLTGCLGGSSWNLLVSLS